MNQNWPTKEKDIHIAQSIMEEHAYKQNSETLGLFELVVDQDEKRMDFQLSRWVLVLAERFNKMYGTCQGEQVTRLVISRCLTQGQTLH